MKSYLKSRFPNLIRRLRILRAWLAAAIYGFPAKKLYVIGVTGTNGKTTVAHMIGDIFVAAGHQAVVLTTTAWRVGQKSQENFTTMTTINPFLLQRWLRRGLQAGCTHAVLEVSSHSLDQERVWGVRFRVAIFTNLTHEHLDYHHTMTEYRRAKEKLFARNPEFSIVNIDDPVAHYFLRIPAGVHVRYGLGGRPDVAGKQVKLYPDGSTFLLVTDEFEAPVKLKVPGKFNIQNALAAAAVGMSQGIAVGTIIGALQKFAGVPGRLQRVSAGQPFEVIVDFALTPDALQKVFETLRPTVRGRIISVLGATGRRDASKRPLLGAIAGHWADLVVVTNEDPYDEDPEAIMRAVAAGIPRSGRAPKKEGEDYMIIPDRREAIRFALRRAQKGDLVLITGKGGERWMVTKEGKVPWDEVKIVREELAKLQ